MEKMGVVGVIGAGMMGAEIALCFAMHGSTVLLKDVSLALAEAGKKRLEKITDKWVHKGRMTSDDRTQVMERIRPLGDYSGFEKAEIVIEAVIEDVKVKGATYRDLEEVCGKECIFASNTSSLSISTLASFSKRPERFVGMHFFSPASVMKLIEVVPGIGTSQETAARAIEIGRSIDKEPVRVSDRAGFVINRLLFAFFNEAWRIVDEGVATPADVDKAVKLGLNHPNGVFEGQDFVGLDLALAVTTSLQEEFGDRFRPAPILKRMVAAGQVGRKAKKGWFDYGTEGK